MKTKNNHFHKLIKCNRTAIPKITRTASGLIIWLLFGLNQIACTKLVEVSSPITSTNSANVYASDATAAATLTGIYTTMSQANFTTGGFSSLSFFGGLSADELSLYPGSVNSSFIAYYRNALSDENTGGSDFWTNIYPVIYVTNSAIAGLTNNSLITPSIDRQLLGEAKFIRAFCYFYLTNLYRDVPLVTGTDYTKNDILPRTSQALVYQQIVADLKDAQNLLSTEYLDATLLAGTTERTRPTKAAAEALLARTYLYTKDWTDAENEADSVIDNTQTYSLSSNLDSVFLKNSKEAIWQLQPVLAGQNTQDAIAFILTAGPNTGLNPVYLSPFLLSSFEPGDLRYQHWVGVDSTTGTKYYYPFKYKQARVGLPVTEYETVFRLGEQFLIRAEARAQNGNLAGAQSDLNTIRFRAALPATPANSSSDLVSAILHEKRVELFTEWGHRWLDLKRTMTADSVMAQVTPQKGGSWNTDWQWYPITASELDRDPFLIQNSGY